MLEKDKCKLCKGDKVIDNEKKLEVPVEQGVMDGKKYIFSGEGDEYHEVQAGDVVVVIKIEQNKVFSRVGADLYINKQITLLEALTGFVFEIKHLDDEVVSIGTAPGEVIKHMEVKCV